LEKKCLCGYGGLTLFWSKGSLRPRQVSQHEFLPWEPSMRFPTDLSPTQNIPSGYHHISIPVCKPRPRGFFAVQNSYKPIFPERANQGETFMKWWWLNPFSFTRLSSEERRAKMILGGWTILFFLIFYFFGIVADETFVLKRYVSSLITRCYVPFLLAVFLARPMATLTSPEIVKKGDVAAVSRVKAWRADSKTRPNFFGPSVDEIAKTKQPEDIQKKIKASRTFIVFGILLMLLSLFFPTNSKVENIDLAEKALGLVIGALCAIFCGRDLLRMLAAKRIQDENNSKRYRK
jgi:hypothetical protein